MLFGKGKVGIEDLSDCPQYAEDEQDAYKRRQVGDGFEDWYEHQTAHAKEEHRLALHLGEVVVHTLVLTEIANLEFAVEAEREDVGRHEHRHK